MDTNGVPRAHTRIEVPGPTWAKVWYAILVVVTMSYLLLRAIHVPLIHDEANSFWWYVRTGEFLPFHAHLDPGNHVLNSLVGWSGHGLFGPHPLALRMGSLVAALLYALACWRTTETLRHAPVRWTVLLALLWCPFLLDYFALFRGYALGVAMWCWALVGFQRYVRHPRLKHALLTAGALTCAAWANLTFLPGAVMFSLALGMHSWWRGWGIGGSRGRLAPSVLFLSQTVCLLPAVAFALDLERHGLLAFGRDELIRGTLLAMCETMFPAWGSTVLWMMLGVVCSITIWTMWRYAHRASGSRSLPLLLAVFWGELLLRWLMHALLRVHFPPERSALHLLPMIILIVGLGLDELVTKRAAWSWFIPLLLLVPLRAVTTMNLDHVCGSPDQGVPERFAQVAASSMDHLVDRPLLATGPVLIEPGWAFELLRKGLAVNDLAVDRFDTGAVDLRVVPAALPPNDLHGYVVVDSFPGIKLLRREHPLELELISDTLFGLVEGAREYVELHAMEAAAPAGTERYVRVDGRLTLGTRVGDVQVIAQSELPDGEVVRDDAELRHVRSRWEGESFSVLRRLPRAAVRTKVYLWNATRAAMTIRDLHVRVYVLADGPYNSATSRP